MIPLKLALRNFMCYKETPVISFESVHTACISGNNGNGKSALIDAITWALWGETRASSDDDLIHSGQSEAQVDLDFEVERLRYHVMRKRTRARSLKTPGKTLLELQAVSTEGLKPLTGDTISQTESKIRDILHMDYQTFINSAFIRQGHANEFSTKRPAERKQVLSNILQLSFYEELKDRAREVAKKEEAESQRLESETDSLRTELLEQASCLIQYEDCQKEAGELEQAAAREKAALDLLRTEQLALENRKKQIQEISAHLAESERNLALWADQAEKHALRIREYQQLIDRKGTIEEDFRRLSEIRRQGKELESKARQFRLFESSRVRLEMEIRRGNDLLSAEHSAVAARLVDLENITGRIPDLEKQLLQLEGQLRAWESEEAAIVQTRGRRQESQARALFLQAERTRLLAEMKESREKLELLSHPGEMKCPLCETELGAEGHLRVEKKYQEEIALLVAKMGEAEEESAALTTDLTRLDREIGQAEEKLKKARTSGLSKLGSLNKALADAREAQTKAAQDKTYLAEIERRLVGREFARAEQVQLREIETQLSSLGYDGVTHELLIARQTELEPCEQPHNQLAEAEKSLAVEAEAQQSAALRSQEIKSRLAEDKSRLSELETSVKASPFTLAGLSAAERQHQELLERGKSLQSRLGGLKARLERFAEVEMRLREKQERLSAVQKEEKVYRELSQAFGKEGIQAMLIEMAIPEIEIEANKLLSLMTDGRMHVKLEAQKETQKGDIVETLDLNVTDELGTRNYEMFSGGEAFRIDFAVRIALSRLLAHRAGAPLSTLIIDEGFGTQDSSGIEKVKEAITAIQDSFEKILVITHIADFKDAFPARFEVVKTQDGSTVYLN